jgi:hypothetical protein
MATLALSVTDAMIRTLADYLKAPLPTALAAETDPVGDMAHVTSGWERIGHDMVFPTVSIDAPVDGERLSSSPTPITIVEASPGSAMVDVYYHVGSVETPIQINIFAESPEQRGRVLHALEQALQGDVLVGAGDLQLDSSHYYDLPIGYRREGNFRNIDTEGSVGGDEWRAVGTVLADSHEIVREIVTYFEP